MNDLEQRIELAKRDQEQLSLLLIDYLPFIKKQIAGMLKLGLEYDDMLSISMMVFISCVRQYQIGKGSFLAFAQVSIRNRLIDENRKENRNRIVTPMQYDSEEPLLTAEKFASLQNYDKEKERQNLCEEIEDLSLELAEYEITIPELAHICPRQSRARLQCFRIAAAIAGDDRMRITLLKFKKVSQSDLAKQFGISPKTIEKHRKYIVALVLLLTGDYPGIQAFLPQMGEVEV